ncbi:MAG: apolipoprotein N-acyltransferase [Candidatus Omnitrophica bacterium]|jgi:apolipoprotein N-acyltransferase|nr:apolipoprotein N-acyltransferase [Candidatus Omnitrophota bacterium]MDD3274856.1 apolipoprotein N-acyltransferase [Candidatus Omnitrophota bacterium]MDD5078034.1 apolipoprotein N-acyltransferase [Candidatus Omnitrophota bacterium]MDD5725033.1 apolipoprotein N-acyltransferase [Candidatus Omnitrophota bacterium]
MTPLVLSAVSAALLSVSFCSLNSGWLAWCGLVPFLLALEGLSLSRTFWYSFFCGAVFWSLAIYWLIHVTLLGQVILICYLAVYFSAFGVLVYLARSFSPLRYLFFLPSCWVLLEYLRSHLFTGFPWALIAFSQYRFLPVIQVSDLTGAWGVSFLVIMANTAFYLLLRRRQVLKIIFTFFLFLCLVLGYGFVKLGRKIIFSPGRDKVRISVIQGNIPQDLKWDRNAAFFILNRYHELTVAASAGKPGLIVWPESSVPGLLGRDEAEFAQVYALAGELNTGILVGAVSYSGLRYFNSALYINRDGSPGPLYHKIHLVPFGEYIPLKNIFPFLETIAPIGDIQAGKDFVVFKKPVDFGVLICFEDLFPELSREFIRSGAKFLVNITNDAWYKETSAPYQHFAASVFRSVENRVYLARSANTGISGFIDPFGRILKTVKNTAGKEIFVEGYCTQDIYPEASPRTVYNRYGDFFIILCFVVFIFPAVRFFFKRRNPRQRKS